MAYAIGSLTPVRLVDTAGEHAVRNDGPDSVVIARDPLLAASEAAAFTLPNGSEERVDLQEGEAIFAICGSGHTASVEVI